jgi:tetratricopeptide (TPR) repeat protein
MAANGRGPIVVTLILLFAVVVAGFGWWWNVLGPGARIRRDAQRAVDEAKSSSGEAGDGAGSAKSERFSPTSIAPNDAGFVGTAACVDCHAERVREFVTTDHFRTSRPLDPSRFDTPGGPATGELLTSDPHVAFRIDRIDGVPRQRAQRTGEQPLDDSAPLEVSIGAGNYDEDFFFWRGERLFQAPLVWYHPDRFWCNAPGFVDGEIDFRRQVLPRCLECHATYAEPIAGSVNGYRKDSIGWGIGCERCHGPAAEHVARHRADPDDPEARAIVMPAELSRERSIDLCDQCHGNATVRRTAPFSFRPGDAVAEHFRPDRSDRPEEDHTSNQSHYLRQSACFIGSPAMTCVTCHDPHAGREAQRAGSYASCAKCHESADCGARPELAEGIRDRCVDCHMPERPVANITFDTRDDRYAPLIRRFDHRIAVHPDAAARVEREGLLTQSDDASAAEAERLREVLIGLLRDQADAMRAVGRDGAEALPLRELIELDPTGPWRERLDASQAERREVDRLMHQALVAIDGREFDGAIELLEEVIERRPDFALAHGKLGLVLAETGRIDEGKLALARVAETDPDDGYGAALLGFLALREENWAEAERYYREAAALEPYEAKIALHWGQALARLGRDDEALAQFALSLEIEPGRIDSQLEIAAIRTRRGEHDEALRITSELAAVTLRRDPAVLLALADAYEGAGKYGEAAVAVGRAIPLVGEERRAALESRRTSLFERSDSP